MTSVAEGVGGDGWLGVVCSELVSVFSGGEGVGVSGDLDGKGAVMEAWHPGQGPVTPAKVEGTFNSTPHEEQENVISSFDIVDQALTNYEIRSL